MAYKFGPPIKTTPMHTLVLTHAEVQVIEMALEQYMQAPDFQGDMGHIMDALAKITAEVNRQWDTHKGKAVLDAYKTSKGYK